MNERLGPEGESIPAADHVPEPPQPRHFPDRPERLTEHEMVERFPAARRVKVRFADLVTAERWDESHRDGYLWEGNLIGRILVGDEGMVVELRGRDTILADHVLATDARFGFPVEDYFQDDEMRYDVRQDWTGVAYHHRDRKRV